MLTSDSQAEYAIYLLDPGPHGPGLMALLQEITGRGAGDCAEIVQSSPAYVTACRTRPAAEDLIARFREFEAIAVVRPVSQPPPEGDRTDPLGAEAPPALPWALGVLGALQIAAALWWIRDGRLLPGLAGLLLGALVLAASVLNVCRNRR